jgi:hypothetical protein
MQSVVQCLSLEGDVIYALSKWLYEQDKAWYQQGIHKLVCPWHKTVGEEADFMKKIKCIV